MAFLGVQGIPATSAGLTVVEGSTPKCLNIINTLVMSLPGTTYHVRRPKEAGKTDSPVKRYLLPSGNFLQLAERLSSALALFLLLMYP